MYNKRKTCCQATLASLVKSAGDNAEKKLEVVSTFFNVERDEVESAKARIKSLLVLDEYFYYVFGKTVLDAKSSELEELKSNDLRFLEWSSRRGSPLTIEGLSKAILFLKTNLR